MFNSKRNKNTSALDKAVPSHIDCHVVGEVFSDLDSRANIVVLDVGPAAAATVNFFSQTKCRIFFPDLYTAPFISGSQPDLEHSDLVTLFIQMMGLKPDLKLDYCLFWDFFSYLKRSYILAMIDAIRPHLCETTRGYCLGSRHTKELPNFHYGIADNNVVTQSLRDHAPLKMYSHPQSEMSSILKPFVITKSRLILEGRIEYFLVDKSVVKESPNAVFL